MSTHKDAVIIVGGGLAGLVAAYELTKAEQHVIIVDQENEACLGGQAFWSLGGIFLVNSPEQRWMGIKDSLALAKQDWFNSAAFDRDEDEDVWARQWADAFVAFAADGTADGLRSYLGNLGLRFMSNVGWAERGSGTAGGHGNSVPRFHVTWGTGPEVVRIFREPLLKAEKAGLLTLCYRHRVDGLIVEDGAVVGVHGTVLEPSDGLARGVASTRTAIRDFSLQGRAVIVTSGGIGGDVERVKAMWPKTMGRVPQRFVIGVPAHVDGRMLEIAENAGARLVNKDRMWHYTEGLTNWDPIWPTHGIRVIPGPSSLWLDATGKRLPPPYFPGCDTLGTLKYLVSATPYDYSWFILDDLTVGKEFSLSGSEQNPDITGKSLWELVKQRLGGRGTGPVRAFMEHGADFVVRDTLPELVEGMNELGRDAGGPELAYTAIEHEVLLRDSQLDNLKYSKDAQLMLVNNARGYLPERISRVAAPHKLLDGTKKKLIAVRLNIITRKTLGGIQTNLDSQVLRDGGEVYPGLYAAGEVAGFGGGGVHGYSSLEGTFLSGCIFSGRAAGRALARQGGYRA